MSIATSSSRPFRFTPTIAKAGIDETAPVAKYNGADPMKETRETVVASKFALYGPLKALSEKEAEKWFPGKTLIIRPGLIVGPGRRDGPVHLLAGADRSRRRSAGAGRSERSGADSSMRAIWRNGRSAWSSKARPEFTTRPGRRRTGDGRNAGGDQRPRSKSDAKFTWVPAEFLEEQKVAPWSDMPVWVPPSGEKAGLARHQQSTSGGARD